MITNLNTVSINPSAIKKLTLKNKTYNPYDYILVHKKGESYFSIRKFKKQFYDDDIYEVKNLPSLTYTRTELLNNGNIIEDGKVTIAPRIVISYIDDTEDIIYFKTYEKAEEYYNNLNNKLLVVKLENIYE